MPTISICLPAYNGAKFIGDAIEAALAQTNRDFELLISDDSSTDETWQIIERFSKSDSRIQSWRNEANVGLFANYNKCMERASGKLIKLYAQDDLWDSNLLSEMLSAFEDNGGIALVACDRNWVDESGSVIINEKPFPHTGRYASTDVIKQCLLSLANWIGEPSCVMFPREFVGAGFNTAYHHLGDLEFWLRVLQNGDFYFLADSLCQFLRHAASCTNRNIQGLLFAADMLQLAEDSHETLRRFDLEEDEFKHSAMRLAAAHVGALHRNGDLCVDSLLNQRPQNPRVAAQLLEAYKKLSYFSLLSLARTDEGWNARLMSKELELSRLETELSQILDSKRWKTATAIGNAARTLKGISNRTCNSQ